VVPAQEEAHFVDAGIKYRPADIAKKTGGVCARYTLRRYMSTLTHPLLDRVIMGIQSSLATHRLYRAHAYGRNLKHDMMRC